MSEIIVPVNTAADTFQVWIDKTNQCINVLSNGVVTVAQNSVGAFTIGNGTVTGIFGTNGTFFANTLRGGSLATPASINVVSNVHSNAVLRWGNATANVFTNSVLIQVVNSTAGANMSPDTFATGQTIVNAISLTIGNSSVNVVVNASNLTVGGNLTANATTLRVGNSVTNALANATQTTIQDASAVSTLNSTAVALGANARLSTTTLSIGNSIANLIGNSITVVVANATNTTTLTPTSVTVGTTTVNTTAMSVGANASLTSTTLAFGNSTVNAVVNATVHLSQNSTVSTTYGTVGALVGANVILGTVSLGIGNSTVNSVANSLQLMLSDTAIVTKLTTAAVNVGANAFLSTTTLSIGNSTVNAFANSLLVKVANSTQIANLQPGQLLVGTTVVNGSQITLNSNLQVNSTVLQVGNSLVNASLNSTSLAFNGVGFALPMKVAQNATSTFSNTRINFIAGDNIFLDVTQDPGSGGQINVQINAVSATGTAIINGANSYVCFNDNTNFNGTAGFTFNKTTNNVLIGNTLFVTTNVATNTVALETQLLVGANISVTTTTVSVGNSVANLLANSILIKLANSTGIANLSPYQLTIGTSVVNSTAAAVTAVVANTVTYSNGSIQQTGFSYNWDGTLANTIDFFLISTYRAAQYFYTIKDETANAYHAGSLNILNDGTNGLIEEFGVIVSNTDLGTFQASQNATHILLRFTSLAANTTIKGTRTLIPV